MAPHVGFPADGAAPGLAAVLTELVNVVYAAAEDGMWRPGTPRTSTAEIADLLAAGELLVAERDGTAVGCVRVRRTADGAGEFSMLAADPLRRGSGIGRDLVAAAEEHCRATGCALMRLELLVPRDRVQPSKVFLHEWYTRIGYRRARIGAIEDDHPGLAPSLAAPCDYVVYEKPLGVASEFNCWTES